ncbi:transcription termination/antitermination NusG family protein [Mesorhizobium sp. 1M-11]|uniref:transcription termination/antitermination protein NusG n=1 Tax=Mesorhizobium sp. 1M-11 TaxID=1529006 RepID=UPI0006C748AD|nr:transcription termination/antitermination NusG family protein [Mesorhizobium sp. 1M-11]
MSAPQNDNRGDWYIVSCHPHAERQACAEIAALGQTVYLPSLRKEFHHRRYRKWIRQHYPLWPGYLLVLASEHWSRVLDCQHVTRVLRSQTYAGAGMPIAIHDADVQAIRLAQDTGQFDEMRVDRATVKPGDRLKLHEGALTGQAGTVESLGDARIVLLINAMGRELRTVVPVERVVG